MYSKIYVPNVCCSIVFYIQSWKHPKSSLVKKCISNKWYVQTMGYQMYQFAGVALTKYHPVDGLNNRNLFMSTGLLPSEGHEGTVSSRLLSLACKWPSAYVFSHYLLSTCFFVHISPFYKPSSHADQSPQKCLISLIST